MTDTPQNRVWIELEMPWLDPKKKRDINHALGASRAALASNLINRLTEPEHRMKHHQPVWWNETKMRYCFVLDSAGSYVTADDHGHWYNLDYMGRPVD